MKLIYNLSINSVHYLSMRFNNLVVYHYLFIDSLFVKKKSKISLIDSSLQQVQDLLVFQKPVFLLFVDIIRVSKML